MIPRALLCLALVLPLAAQGLRQRSVQPSHPGPQRLEVDLRLLGGSASNLADLRLLEAGGREVPYVVVPPGSSRQSWRPAPLLALPATKEHSGFEMDLGEAVQVSRMRVDGLWAPFLKRFRLEGSGDRQRWTELVNEGSLFDLPEEGLRLLDVDFPEGEYRYLRLVWDDRSSARMALPRSAAVQGRAVAHRPFLEELTFERRPALEPGTSRFAVHLPGPRLALKALILDVAGQGPLLREASVSESRMRSRELGSDLAPVRLGQAQLRRIERSGASASDLRIPIESPEGTDLDLCVEDGNNPPLELKRVRAELESQPWIYFESRDGAPLTARWGDPKLQAPRYDLEALRDRLDPARIPSAAWGAVSPAASPSTDSVELNPGLGASLSVSGFSFRRPVPDTPPGLAALVLDAHVLAHSRNFHDLRLISGDGHQIPYLLEQRDEPMAFDLSLGAGKLQQRRSVYTLALPETPLPPSRLVIETSASVFRRTVRILEEKAGLGAVVLAESEWAWGDPSKTSLPLVLTLPPLEGRQLSLEIEEGDNQPLPLKAIRLLLPAWRLRFFHPGSGVTLAYGQELEAPRYDLAMLAGRLRSAGVQELNLPPLSSAPGVDKAPLFTRIFWGVLIVAVVALLFLLGRLLKPVSDSDSPGGEP